MWLLIGIWSENITTKIRFEPFYSIKVDSVCGFLKKFWHCCRTLCCYKMYAYCPNFTSPTFFHFIKNSEFWLHSLTEKIMAKSKIFKIATGSKVALKLRTLSISNSKGLINFAPFIITSKKSGHTGTKEATTRFKKPLSEVNHKTTWTLKWKLLCQLLVKHLEERLFEASV